MKKFISLVLISVLIVVTLISCGNNETADITESSAENNQSTEILQDSGENTSPARIEPDLPGRDFDGYTFTFYAHKIDYPGDWVGDGDPKELVAEEETGDLINDAVFRRNRTIEERYNINIAMKTSSDDLGTLRKTISAGDNLYDAAVIFNNSVPSVVTADLLVNIDRLPYVDLSKPWWDPAVKEMSIANQNYLLGGDLLLPAHPYF